MMRRFLYGIGVVLGIVAGCSPGYFFFASGVQAERSADQRQDAQMATLVSTIYDFTLNDIDGNPVER